jgi:hypothetical protein
VDEPTARLPTDRSKPTAQYENQVLAPTDRQPASEKLRGKNSRVNMNLELERVTPISA